MRYSAYIGYLGMLRFPRVCGVSGGTWWYLVAILKLFAVDVIYIDSLIRSSGIVHLSTRW